jgi:hypothetical protein
MPPAISYDRMFRHLALAILSGCLATGSLARDLQVSANGGSPYQTISSAARDAQPGDIITVHAGTYRERITPPRGGESESRRIIYQAAPGETVIIKGSEIIRDWKPFPDAPGVWKVVVPNTLFGRYNPYKDLIAGDWFDAKGRPHHTGEVYLNGKSLWETHLFERVLHPEANETWFAEVDDRNTYIYANFRDRDPNRELVEINVRDSCFYPDQPGRNYITVRGFRMMHAATQWAAPTAEQIALLGTHWSKGWIIENNTLSDSKCSCLTLGKDRATGHNVWNADPRKDGATHYNEVILRALDAGWSREKIGGHVVRNNAISNCEQAGIAGSLGAVFSIIENNHIYNIWTKRQFAGAEIAGIKLHAAIDVVIRNNHIHGVGRGLWMDWMAQGTHITHNTLYDNSVEDLFVEVDHGPFVVDNNVFLSGVSLNDMSEGGAYVNNLFAGRLLSRPEPRRSTPFHRAHSTALAGLASITGGDDRFYNNIFIANAADSDPRRQGGFGLWVYNHREFPLQTGGNVYLQGARPYATEIAALNLPECNPKLGIREESGQVYLLITLPELPKVRPMDATGLGKTKVAGLPYESVESRGLAGPFDNSACAAGCKIQLTK